MQRQRHTDTQTHRHTDTQTHTHTHTTFSLCVCLPAGLQEMIDLKAKNMLARSSAIASDWAQRILQTIGKDNYFLGTAFNGKAGVDGSCLCFTLQISPLCLSLHFACLSTLPVSLSYHCHGVSHIFSSFPIHASPFFILSPASLLPCAPLNHLLTLQL